MKPLGLLPAVVLFLVPLLAGLAMLLPGFTNEQAFSDLITHPQFWGGLKLSITTGFISTLIALLLAVVIAMGSHKAMLGQSGALLAVPHLAFAIGLAFFIDVWQMS